MNEDNKITKKRVKELTKKAINAKKGYVCGWCYFKSKGKTKIKFFQKGSKFNDPIISMRMLSYYLSMYIDNIKIIKKRK